ncbi:MAG: Asp-tRNA(Asn)/Glu-tRNA(Gln) amidotransferase subunit GatC [Adlercreutzia sp.]
MSNVMRDDEVRGSFTQEVALENAPKQEDGSFLIPSILGEGGDR